MASGWTNIGLGCVLNSYFRDVSTPSSFKLALLTVLPSSWTEIETMAQLTELAGGNGYTQGGATVARSAVGFDVLVEDDANDVAYIQLADVTWNITGSGISGVMAAALLDSAGTPNVVAGFDLNGPVSQVSGQPFVIKNAELRFENDD